MGDKQDSAEEESEITGVNLGHRRLNRVWINIYNPIF